MDRSRQNLLPTWTASALLLIAAVTATSVILSLGWQNRALKDALATEPVASGRPVPIATGEVLPNLRLTSSDGDPGDLYSLTGGGVAVVGLMTTTCPYCEQNLDRWTDLATLLSAEGIPFVGLSFDNAGSVSAFVEEQGVTWSIWVARRGDLKRVLRFPTTLVLGSVGEVIGSAVGVLSPDQVASLAELATSSSSRH